MNKKLVSFVGLVSLSGCVPPIIYDGRSASEQYNMGESYHVGDYGGIDNPHEAAVWYKLAAHRGHRMSQRMLGHMYKNGEGVAQDYDKSISWYEKAAAQGDRMSAQAISKIVGIKYNDNN